MVSGGARAKTVMAALDRRIFIQDLVGQSWAAWIARTNISVLDDMSIFGQFPAHDEFFLVLCSHCGHVVKPQAFERHCERRHSLFSKLYGAPTNCSSDRPQQDRPPSQHGSLCVAQDGRNIQHKTSSFSHHDSPKPDPEEPSLQLAGDVSHLMSHLPEPPEKVLSSAEKPIQKNLNLNGSGTYVRTGKKFQKKQCDLNVHCGVMDPKRKKLCTRLLTCKIHSIHQRRLVAGRQKPFDQLVMELKMRSTSGKILDRCSDNNTSPSKSRSLQYACQITNSSIVRSVNPIEGFVEIKEEVMRIEEPQLDPLSANHSNKESDGESHEELANLPASTFHPKPLAFCTFGARVLGRGVLAFDRRLLRLWSAFSVMMEQRLSTYLWNRKLPQVSELGSNEQVATTNTHNSTLRTISSGQSEPTPSYKPSTKAQSTSNAGQQRICAGHTSKPLAQSRFREPQESPTASKRRKCLREEENSKGLSKILFGSHHQPYSLNRTRSPTLFNGNKIKETGLPSRLSRNLVEFDEPEARKRKTNSASSTKRNTCPPEASILSSMSLAHPSPVSRGADGTSGTATQKLPKKHPAVKVPQ
ncbi:hypothetical protein DNTS_010323 [Danionella cerebrum]|uniref:SCA7 domain-containing protein n=1 Tax=Danionella cerebrum TaxID=2873325 RepID=A0A553RFM1_9TELE|nr:hypothetical protein DNTS_010323 [Danionella translucida]